MKRPRASAMVTRRPAGTRRPRMAAKVACRPVSTGTRRPSAGTVRTGRTPREGERCGHRREDRVSGTETDASGAHFDRHDESGSGVADDGSATDASGVRLDWGPALDAVAGDRELLAKVIDGFLGQHPSLIAELRTAFEAGDLPVVRRVAHTIAGSLRSFEGARVVALAEALEDRCREGAAGARRRRVARTRAGARSGGGRAARRGSGGGRAVERCGLPAIGRAARAAGED